MKYCLLLLAITSIAAAQPFTLRDIAFVGSLPQAGASDPEAWSYNATLFGGAASVKNSGPLDGVSNGKTFTLSFWIKMVGSDNAYQNIFIIGSDDGNGNTVAAYRGDNGYLYMTAYNAARNNILNASAYPAQLLIASNWVHVFISVNLATSTFNLYQNGVSTAYVNSIADDTIPFAASTNNTMVGRNVSAYGNFRLSEAWFSTSYTATPANWRNGSIPKDLGSDGSVPTGSQPLVYLKNAYSTFQNNAGSGGSFTADTGTLEDSNSDKP